MSEDSYTPYEYEYRYDPGRYASSSSSEFSFADLGFVKNKMPDREIEVDTSVFRQGRRGYDTYDNFSVVDINHKSYTNDYLAD